MQRRLINSEFELFRDSARKFFQLEIRPNSQQWRDAGIVDRAAFLKAGANGFLCMWVEEAYGGLGLQDFRYEQILIEENAAYGDPGFFMTLHSRLAAPYLQRFGTDEQRRRFYPGLMRGETILAIAMTEADAGSDLAGMKTRAEDKGNQWLLNGSKPIFRMGFWPI